MAIGAVALTVLLSACVMPAQEETVLLHVPDDPTVTFKVWFKVGSQHDPVGKEGLAWLTGQMISDASTTNNAYDSILAKLYPLASGYGIRVDREMTVITGRTHRDNLDAYFELFADAWLRPAFLEEDFERLRTDGLNEIENSLRYASDEELGKAALYGFVFDGTRYAHPTVGTVQGLKSITLEDVKQFYATYYTRDNAVPALGGGFDEATQARFEAAVAELPEGAPVPAVAVAPESFDGRRLLLVDKPDGDASISFGFPIEVRRGEREFYALWVANSWLGEHRNSASHLYQVIRETRGMNYGDYSYIESFPGGGRRSMPPTHVGRNHQIFEVWIRTLPNEQAHFAVRAAMRELTSLVEEGMSEEEFELTRAFLKKYILHFADTTQSRLGYAVDDLFYGIEEDGHLARFRRVLDDLTLDEVNAAVRKHLPLDRIKFAIVTGDAQGLKQAMLSEAESPMEYASPKSAEVLEEDEAIAAFPLGLDPKGVEVIPAAEFLER
jgi:zinc protease